MKFLDRWKMLMYNTIKRIDPEVDSELLEEILDKYITKDVKNPRTALDNNYIKRRKDVSLLSILDWVGDKKPIIAGNGTFYKNQHEALNPRATMLNDKMKSREAIKKEMFKYKDDPDKYADLDMDQNNEKIITNSYYGGSGMKSSAMYSEYSGPATTLTAQSVISTTMGVFEAVVGDNFKFLDINECFHWMNLIVEQDYEMPKWVKRISRDDLFNRIKSLFYDETDEYDDVIRLYVNNLDESDVSKIFYKNQFIKFIDDNDYIRNLYKNIIDGIVIRKHIKSLDELDPEVARNYKDVDSYNDMVNMENFLNPNAFPLSVSDLIKEFRDEVFKCVYVPYLTYERINRLKHMTRKAVIVVDTDSNMINCDGFVQYTLNNIVDKSIEREEINNVFISVNTMAAILSKCIDDILFIYGGNSNIPEEFRHHFNMKNEFLFLKIVVSKKKKRYVSSIILREGNLLNPLKYDIKGHDFMKSTTSEKVSTIYHNIVKNRILANDDIDILGIQDDLNNLIHDIEQSIKSGGKEYLPLASAKDIGAYADPYKMQTVRGVYAWDILHPDKPIELPAKINIVKMNIFTLDDIKSLEHTNPEIYNKIKTKIFENKLPAISKKGLQVLAIPQNGIIPEWAIPYVDYNTIVNNIIGQFSSITNTVDMGLQPVGKMINSVNRKTDRITNIVRI